MYGVSLGAVLIFLAIILIGLIVCSIPFIIAGYYFGGVLGGVAGATVIPVGYYAYTKYKRSMESPPDEYNPPDGKKIEVDTLVQK